MAPLSKGLFGEPTATIDWCERNYEVNKKKNTKKYSKTKEKKL